MVNKLVKQIGQWLEQWSEGVKRFLFGGLDKSSEQADRKRDDKYSDLEPPQYLNYRLEDQFDWYRKKCKQLDRQLQSLQTWVYLLGGTGTFLAAVQLQSWVAVTTGFTGALINYLEFKRVEATLVGYNQAADALYDIRAWWTSLSTIEQKNPENFALLVKSTEETIRSEHTSWLQDMQDKLAQLYGKAETPEDEPEQPPETMDSEEKRVSST